MAKNNTVTRYGVEWNADADPLRIEFECIAKGGVEQGKWGVGLWKHYRNAQTILWPFDDHHRWSDIILKNIIENEVSVVLGPGDSSKTYSMVKFGLVDWFCQPYNTLILVSSTDVRGLEVRIWGKIKELFNYAKDRYPWLPGYVIESAHAITPDSIDDRNERGRTYTKGIICIPCIQGSQYVGLGKFIGVKPACTPGRYDGRLRHLGDEVQAMKRSFLDAYSNWYGKPNFKGVMCGNPFGVDDPLGIAAEPLDGWTAMPTPTKTTSWRSRFFNASVINLVGSDSPNFDPATPDKYPYLIGRRKMDMVAKTYSKDSFAYSSQCEGVMRPGMSGKRIVTREMCRQHGAQDKAIWLNTNHTKIYGCDPAYGGGDRCVGIMVEFGEGTQGKHILCVSEPDIIPVKARPDATPESQIALYIQQRLQELGVPSENCFYDATGKGTMGNAFAQVFGHVGPVAVSSGDKATKRPMRFDLFVDGRLKRCDEEYFNFITEMWFSVAEVIQSGQMRELPDEVRDEFCLREFVPASGNRKQVEPKDKLKEKFGFSPDLADCLAIATEGARRRGFRIERLADQAASEDEETWWDIEAKEYDNTLKSKLLTHV